MKVLVDTCIWSIALKGNDPRNKLIASELETLIDEGRLAIIGPIKQEILSAYKEKVKYTKVRKSLSYFPNIILEDIDFEVAAEFHNTCRGKGVQGSHIDFLICAVAVRLNLSIYTNDKDFQRYQKYTPIELHLKKG